MISLQTILVAEEIQKDAYRRAAEARLFALLPAQPGILTVSYHQLTMWLRSGVSALARTWQSLPRIWGASAPCPTC